MRVRCYYLLSTGDDVIALKEEKNLLVSRSYEVADLYLISDMLTAEPNS
jgi:hypothetical protein